MTPAERAAAIAASARDGPDPDKFQPARSRWIITTPAGTRVEVIMHPPVTQREMARIYPGCKLEAEWT